MRCLILAALVGFCAASTLYSPVDHQVWWTGDDQVTVHGIHGNSYGFTHFPGQHIIDIAINGVNIPAKHIHINGQTCQIVQLQGFHNLPWQFQQQIQGVLGGNYQNHLFHVLSQYQGVVSQYQFAQLLQTIHNHVQQGQICHLIYHLLTALDQVVDEDLVQQDIHGQHQVGVNTPITHLFNQVQGQQGIHQWLNQHVTPSWTSGYWYPGQDYQHHYGGVHHWGVNPVYSSMWGQQGTGVGSSQWVHPSQYYGVGSSHVLDHLTGSNWQQQHQGYVQPWWNHWNNAVVGY